MVKLGISVWEGHVAPVLDESMTMAVYDIKRGCVMNSSSVVVSATSIPDKVKLLRELGLTHLICGAVSREMEEPLILAGVAVRSFAAGMVHDVLDAWLEDRLAHPRFLMPGCRGRRRRHRHGQEGGRTA
jgi:predicted Fe-Mo cluster-binding NifX family protein